MLPDRPLVSLSAVFRRVVGKIDALAACTDIIACLCYSQFKLGLILAVLVATRTEPLFSGCY